MAFEESDLQLLILRSQKNEKKAFHELYTVLVDRVHAYCRARLFSPEDALDCTQQVFIELWRALPTFRFEGTARFYGFLFTITKRQLIRFREEAMRRPDTLIDESAKDESALEHEKYTEINRALGLLNPIDRDIVVLHHWSRYTFGEIGEMLGLAETNVRVRHHRILEKLRTLLTG